MFEILWYLILILITCVSSGDTKVSCGGSSIQPGPEVIKYFSCSTQLLIKTIIPKNTKIKKSLALSLSDVVFIILINVKMPTFVGILTFMSRINSGFSRVEHEQSLKPQGQAYLFFIFQISAYPEKLKLKHQNKEVTCFKSLRCCIYHANKQLLAF